ncbi:MAG: hypothetical protein IPP72_00925 [Chitinophagaceae bacterium]|nr:hypothetical protein [Chitinophagaceae bacterium]
MKKNLLLLAIIFCAFSCKKDNTTPTPATGDLKIGTKWVYKYTSFDAAGTVLSSDNISLTITSQQTVAGETWWVATGSGTPAFIRKTTIGYYTVQNSVSQLQFKVPAAVNDTWRVTYSNSAGDYGDYKVLTLNQNVTVPMGTIACYYAEATDSNSLEDKVWYNNANMLVKQEQYDDNGSGTMFKAFSLELVSFTL